MPSILCVCVYVHAFVCVVSASIEKWSVLACLVTTQALRASAGKSTWGRVSAPQMGLYHALGNGVSTCSPTWTTPINGHGRQFDICFPSYFQVPIDVTASFPS